MVTRLAAFLGHPKNLNAQPGRHLLGTSQEPCSFAASPSGHISRRRIRLSLRPTSWVIPRISMVTRLAAVLGHPKNCFRLPPHARPIFQGDASDAPIASLLWTSQEFRCSSIHLVGRAAFPLCPRFTPAFRNAIKSQPHLPYSVFLPVSCFLRLNRLTVHPPGTCTQSCDITTLLNSNPPIRQSQARRFDSSHRMA